MSPPPFLEARGDEILVAVLVVVRASRTRIVGVHDGRLKIQVAGPPVDGAANKELLRFLSRTLRVPRSAIRLVSGDSARRKRLAISGLSLQALEQGLTLS